MQSDNHLIRKIKRQQNREAAGILVERYYREIYSYIISLRMFYSSIITMILNMFLLAVINGYRGQEMWKLGAAGTSSMFLFAIASISLYHKLAKSSYIGILILLCSVLSTVLLRRGGALFILLFDALPLAVHCVTAVFSLIGFVCYIRKVEKENAYSFAC